MRAKSRILIISNIKLSVSASVKEAFSVSRRRLLSIDAMPTGAEFSVYRRSVDARRRDDIKFVYSVAVRGEFGEISKEKLAKIGAAFDTYEEPEVVFGIEKLVARPIIIGSGPCGLFAALMLAEQGYRPLIVERGGSVAERMRAVERFNRERVLDTDTNIQFGAGGAGTFSDGKLITRINDSMSSYVLKKLVEFGAPKDILYLAKPHIGTDILSLVVDNILKKIEALGGEVMYNTAFLGADFSLGRIKRVRTTRGEFEAGALVLAIGHSARDTYEELISAGLSIESKNFSVGMRIEHLAEDIDRAMYGSFAGNEALGHAEYSLSHNTKQRGVYTFCMCPGGVVVAATSEGGGVVVNGMSYHARSARNSNSAVVCSIFKEDFGSNPLSAISFQRKIERDAYLAGGGDYSAPIITVGDFLNGTLGAEPTLVEPSYMSGGVRIASPSSYLPEKVLTPIKAALCDFNRKIEGFSAHHAILTGAETRTSAPIRILRDNETRLAVGYENLYPAGEGAGYAGGITSASVDGVRTALALMKKYRP